MAMALGIVLYQQSLIDSSIDLHCIIYHATRSFSQNSLKNPTVPLRTVTDPVACDYHRLAITNTDIGTYRYTLVLTVISSRYLGLTVLRSVFYLSKGSRLILACPHSYVVRSTEQIHFNTQNNSSTYLACKALVSSTNL